jgi:hypothetical protein
MKKSTIKMLLLAMVLYSVTGCVTVVELGDLNMVSTRNIDSKGDYTLLRNYMGGTKKELKKSKATDLEQAINAVVKQTPGGEFLKNVKVYQVRKFKSAYYAVEGDVWGIAGNQNMRGFTLGMKVQYPCGIENGLPKKCIGTITDLTNDLECQVKDDETGKVTTEKYSNLKKAE